MTTTKEIFDNTSPHYCECEWNCGQKIIWKESFKKNGIPRFINGHYNRKSGKVTKEVYNSMNIRCHCPCNQLIPWRDYYRKQNYIPKYITGHNWIGKKQSAEHIEKVRITQIGHIVTNETKTKIREKRKLQCMPSKEKHYKWKGGISYLPYCDNFNNKLKEAIRNRDNRTCQLCITNEHGRKLSVHHIHYDKKNCYPDLITLCCSCNVKVNWNKNFYESLFMNKLNDRCLLFWTTEYFKNKMLYHCFKFLFA